MTRQELDRQGLSQNTLIILTSDNGYNSGSHGFGDKVIPYEEGYKSPLIIFDPRLPKNHAGQVSDSVTANVDMTATILALANVPGPEDASRVLSLAITQARSLWNMARPHWKRRRTCESPVKTMC